MNQLKKAIAFALIASIIVFTGCTMAPENPSTLPNPDGLSLQSSKPVYAKNEKVEIELKNNGAKSVYVMPTLFNSLDFSGNVLMGSDKKVLETFNMRASVTSRSTYTVPEPLEIKPGSSQKIAWSGRAYRQTGPDDKNDWESFSPEGKFRVEIYYSNEPDFEKDSIIPTIESSEFEIKSSGFRFW